MICFALLAHKDEQALLDQIRNIRKYTQKDALIVLYNGGTDVNFGKAICQIENVMYCPYSRPLQWGKTGRFFYDVMRWLEETNVTYEYLVYTEYDVMFINYGFPSLLSRLMNGYDAMVQRVQIENKPYKTWWRPGQSMWREWGQWQPFFKRDYFCGTFNPMQVYRQQMVRRMLARIDQEKLEELFATSNVFALGEMLYLTLAVHAGGKCRAYPRINKRYLRFRPPISLRAIKKAKANRHVQFVHPVKTETVRKWICNQDIPLHKKRVVTVRRVVKRKRAPIQKKKLTRLTRPTKLTKFTRLTKRTRHTKLSRLNKLIRRTRKRYG